MKIGIRVDANHMIATGHLMRCLAIASELRRIGKETLFIIKDEFAQDIVFSRGFSVYMIKAKGSGIETEISDLISIIRLTGIEKMVIDSYSVTSCYLDNLHGIVSVLYIDDLNLFRYSVDIVLNYNIYASQLPYNKNYAGTDTRLLLGPMYVPLREEFQHVQEMVINQNVRNVLLTTGGSDPLNFTSKFLKAFKNSDFYKKLRIKVVFGSLNRNLELLTDFEQDPYVDFYKSPQNMADLMKTCDVAITAGGSTLYELCACGVPSICFSFVDNQLLGVIGFAEADLMYYAGDIRDDINKCVAKSLYYLEQYSTDVLLRTRRSRRMQEMIDGQGVFRIVKALLA